MSRSERLPLLARSGNLLPTTAGMCCCRVDGAALWAAVLAAWRHYAEWLTAVVPLMALLSECVSAERAAEVPAPHRPCDAA